MFTTLTPREQNARIQTLEVEIKKLKMELLRTQRDDIQYMLRRTINDTQIVLQRMYEAN